MVSMFLACPTYDFNPFTFPALIATFGVVAVFFFALFFLLPFIFRRWFMGFAKNEIGRQAILRRARLARVFARGVAVVGVPLLLATGWLWLQTRSVISCCGMTDTAFLEQSQRLDIADLVAFLVISVALLVVCGGGLIFGLVSLTMNLRQNS